jgi:hypothetical protein
MEKHQVNSKTQGSQEVKAPRVKFPLSFLLEVKDLSNPIEIQRIQILRGGLLMAAVAIAVATIWVSYFKAPSGKKIVENMIAASGGMETWRKLNAGQFKRTHKLYSVSGELMSSRDEIFYFQRTREGIKLMVNARRSGKNPVIIGKDDQGFWAIENDAFVNKPRDKAKDLGMMCDSEFCTPDCDMQMAYFRFSMPFKLKDPGVIPRNAGASELLGETCKVLKIGYDPKVGKDEWVFYVNEKDLIVKMEYHHKTDKGKHLPEEFFWSDHKNVNGLMISHKWTRYWNNGKVLEEYTFSDFDFESPLPDYFYQRPDIPAGLLTFNN